MKKILSIAMTLCMVLMLIPMTLLPVSAEMPTTSKTLLDFEDNNAGVLQWASDGKSSIQANADLSSGSDWTYWTETAGSYSASINGKSQWAGFVLPDDWYTGGYDVGEFHYTTPSAITFDVTPSERRNNTKIVKFGKVAFYQDKIGWDASLQVLLTPDDTSNIELGTKRTVVCPISKDLDLSKIKRFAVNLDAGSTNILIDNIKLVYNTAYTASFNGTKNATLSETIADQLQTMGVADASITLPEATLTDGEFAGWVTKDNPTNIIPAGTKYVLTTDTQFYAVSSTRPVGPTPAAPTLESTTGTSITLTSLGDEFEYKMNDGEWQASNVFTDLAIATKYTFYVRYANSPAYLAGPSSEGAEFETDAVLVVEAESMKTTADSGVSFKPQTPGDNGVAAGQTMVVWEGQYNQGLSGTFTGTNYNLPAGVYEISTYSRWTDTRSAFALTGIDGTGDEQDLGSIDFAVNTGVIPGTGRYMLHKATNQFTIKDSSSISIKFTVSTKRSSSMYLDKIVFTKVADLPVENPLAVNVSTDVKASIRMNQVNGIRFYTTVDTDKIAALEADGATVEMGTLIAPKDLLDGTELTLDLANLETPKAVNVKYQARNEDGTVKYYTEDGFSGIVGTIANIKESNTAYSATSGNITRDFVARGYVKVTKGTDEYVSYADVDLSQSGRSLKTIAAATIGTAFYEGLSSDLQAKVDAWANAVK